MKSVTLSRLILILSPVLLGSQAMGHPCGVQENLANTGQDCGNFHNAQNVVLVRRIQNWTRTTNNVETSNLVVIGRSVKENDLNDQYYDGEFNVSVSVTESFNITAGASTTLKGEVRSAIIPIGASWETSVHLSGGYTNTSTRQWDDTSELHVPPCRRHMVTVSEMNYVINATAQEGTWEHWTYLCQGETEPSSRTLLCNITSATGNSSRFSGVTSRISNATPSTVAGCHDPDQGGGDSDGDGVDNEDDPDVDGDGVPNGEDPDIDGDGIPNTEDPDMDGDGVDNNQDLDMDGDGKDNTDDDDIDGDGVPNDEDSDMDGDGVENDVDDDTDGDGVPNSEDDEPNGPSSNPGWVDVILNLIDKIIDFILHLR